VLRGAVGRAAGRGGEVGRKGGRKGGRGGGKGRGEAEGKEGGAKRRGRREGERCGRATKETGMLRQVFQPFFLFRQLWRRVLELKRALRNSRKTF